MENPIKMDDLGVPLFSEASIDWRMPEWTNKGTKERTNGKMWTICLHMLRWNASQMHEHKCMPTWWITTTVYFFQHIFPFKQQAIGHLCLLIFLPGDQREEAISSAYQGPWCFGWHRVCLGNGVVFFFPCFFNVTPKKNLSFCWGAKTLGKKWDAGELIFRGRVCFLGCNG